MWCTENTIENEGLSLLNTLRVTKYKSDSCCSGRMPVTGGMGLVSRAPLGAAARDRLDRQSRYRSASTGTSSDIGKLMIAETEKWDKVIGAATFVAERA